MRTLFVLTCHGTFKTAPGAAAIGCYPDSERERAAVIRESLAARRITASGDLVEHLGAIAC
jgi:hypothetical protein